MMSFLPLPHGRGSVYPNAAAPLTISIISLVMLAWRTRFIFNVNESITSVALELAASMAVIRAACSAAAVPATLT